MGKMDALRARATAAIPPATATEGTTAATATDAEPWELPLGGALESGTASEARESQRQGEVQTAETPPAVVDAGPLIRAVERLHQGVREELRAVTATTRSQGDYLREMRTAYNAMTTDWYRIAEGLPLIRGELERLETEIAVRQADLSREREVAQVEMSALLRTQTAEAETALRRVRRGATRAILLVAATGVLTVCAVLVLAVLVLHRPL